MGNNLEINISPSPLGIIHSTANRERRPPGSHTPYVEGTFREPSAMEYPLSRQTSQGTHEASIEYTEEAEEAMFFQLVRGQGNWLGQPEQSGLSERGRTEGPVVFSEQERHRQLNKQHVQVQQQQQQLQQQQQQQQQQRKKQEQQQQQQQLQQQQQQQQQKQQQQQQHHQQPQDNHHYYDHHQQQQQQNHQRQQQHSHQYHPKGSEHVQEPKLQPREVCSSPRQPNSEPPQTVHEQLVATRRECDPLYQQQPHAGHVQGRSHPKPQREAPHPPPVALVQPFSRHSADGSSAVPSRVGGRQTVDTDIRTNINKPSPPPLKILPNTEATETFQTGTFVAYNAFDWKSSGLDTSWMKDTGEQFKLAFAGCHQQMEERESKIIGQTKQVSAQPGSLSAESGAWDSVSPPRGTQIVFQRKEVPITPLQSLPSQNSPLGGQEERGQYHKTTLQSGHQLQLGFSGSFSPRHSPQQQLQSADSLRSRPESGEFSGQPSFGGMGSMCDRNSMAHHAADTGSFEIAEANSLTHLRESGSSYQEYTPPHEYGVSGESENISSDGQSNAMFTSVDNSLSHQFNTFSFGQNSAAEEDHNAPFAYESAIFHPTGQLYSFGGRSDHPETSMPSNASHAGDTGSFQIGCPTSSHSGDDIAPRLETQPPSTCLSANRGHQTLQSVTKEGQKAGIVERSPLPPERHGDEGGDCKLAPRQAGPQPSPNHLPYSRLIDNAVTEGEPEMGQLCLEQPISVGDASSMVTVGETGGARVQSGRENTNLPPDRHDGSHRKASDSVKERKCAVKPKPTTQGKARRTPEDSCSAHNASVTTVETRSRRPSDGESLGASGGDGEQAREPRPDVGRDGQTATCTKHPSSTSHERGHGRGSSQQSSSGRDHQRNDQRNSPSQHARNEGRTFNGQRASAGPILLRKAEVPDWNKSANEVLCIDDHPIKGKRYYHAYLCVPQADLVRFGKRFHAELQSWGFRIFLPIKDLLGSGMHFDNISRALEERCNEKIIIILSDNYEGSQECRFITHFAKALDPDAQKRNLIPVAIDNVNHVPNILRGVTVINYWRALDRGYLKDKLMEAIILS